VAKKQATGDVRSEPAKLSWLRAAFHFHTFAYRDPRSAFASGIGLPVVSPTTVILGLVSSLFSIGDSEGAKSLLGSAHHSQVLIDAPSGVVFFRAFHQLRRYETLKYGSNPRFGLTKINQGTREYGLVEGPITIYVAVPPDQVDAARLALINLRHLGTNDSLCSLVGTVEVVDAPSPDVLYQRRDVFAQQVQREGIDVLSLGVTAVTLSTFKSEQPVSQTMAHWKMAGDRVDTELVPYVIPGSFQGTSRGRIYRKRKST